MDDTVQAEAAGQEAPQPPSDIKHRLLRPLPPEAIAPQITPSRALRLAATRAAEQSLRLAVTVLGVAEDLLSVEELQDRLEEGHLIFGCQSGESSAWSGFCAMDSEMRCAVVEMQTLGRLRSEAAPERPITVSDAALAAPVMQRLLAEVLLTTCGTALDGWVEGHVLAQRLSSPRIVGMVLPEDRYRLVRITLDLGTAGRQGELLLALPRQATSAEVPESPVRCGWTESLRSEVMASPAEMVAVLHRMRLPLDQVQQFAIGAVIPLHGTTVSSVRLEAAEAQLVARGRLGQSGGMRALRIQMPEAPVMSDGLGRSGAPEEDWLSGDSHAPEVGALAVGADMPEDGPDTEAAETEEDAMPVFAAMADFDPLAED
ncbi:FliM/FliN family flagellar motor switch protein [Pseudoroseicyclus aestuarii]|uniref:Flagellar motor switch protein FliM n=1 Tax=Pseudoroseicyclus aestuarii TaxID=1795041 RepID=A0A318SW02_9RHOB|nr:flagellar motor switch protein FliM [Pseudoroseicyclus aestuarii]PYE86030.1 flagellar motor switch protein FliM [Pseudoroseicyclus aestuarii]